MARIAGVDLPRGKRIEVALTYIYGIGATRAAEIIRECGVDADRRTQDLDDDDDIGCYRGVRHRRGLPVRGQRTHTNARTHKGSKRSIAGKKKPPKK